MVNNTTVFLNRLKTIIVFIKGLKNVVVFKVSEVSLKRECIGRFFDPQYFHQSTPSRTQKNTLKYIRFMILNFFEKGSDFAVGNDMPQ